MPHRIGNLWDIFVSEENCIKAEAIMSANRPKNRFARYIGRNPEKFGKALSEKLKSGYAFHVPREKDIRDSYKGKVRHLQIPCLEDVAAQQAWLNVVTPYIEKRNYYYNCGSIPKAGQKRAVLGLSKFLRANKPKWGAVTDIRKFYETCPHLVVEKGLSRIIKDRRIIEFGNAIMRSMSSTGVGIAVGFPVSHWLANVALMELDHEMRRLFPDVALFRYMDDAVFASGNKRHLRKAILYYMEKVRELGMSVKRSWQLFPIAVRGITFLSYRFFVGYTILAKRLMFRIARKVWRTAQRLTAHMASGVLSHMGVLKYCNSQHFKEQRVYPHISVKVCKWLVSEQAKKVRVA